MSLKSTYISILLTILAALSCHGQSWNEIKQSQQYLYGEGWGSSDAEADKNALADLISKISVQVQGSFTMTEDEMSHGNDVDGTTYARSKVQTYSQATLTNAEKMVLDYEPDAHVGRYILRSELSRIFESRKKRIQEMLQLAQEAEKQTKIDDALRYYYWSYALLKTLQRPNEATDAAGHVLSSWIPAQMDAIFSAIKVTPMSKTADNVMEVAVTYKGQPVASYDYTYFDGQNWSNIYSAKDGRGVIELNPGAVTDNLRVKSEYEYRSEAHIDNEIDAVLATVKGHAFRKSYLAVSGRTPSNSESRMALASIETKQSEPVVEPMTDDADYRKIIDKVLAAITTKNYASAEQFFTPQGATMFRSLISYGKARVLDTSDLTFCQSTNGVVCRNAKMSFTFKNNVRSSFVEDVVFTFNAKKRIDYIAFGLGKQAESDILGNDNWDLATRKALMNFLENYKTAFALKRLDYLQSVFDDNAVIISGCTVNPGGNRFADSNVRYAKNQYVRYTRESKKEYLARMARSFASKEFINIRFSNNVVKKYGKGMESYAIQIKQDYYSSNYGDSGYLFLYVDMNDPDNPVIKVRTWQPKPDPNFGLVDEGYIF